MNNIPYVMIVEDTDAIIIGAGLAV